jgi:molecular chaperone GrpE
MELKKKSPKESVEIAKLEAEKTELINDLQRTRADFENFRKQVELQKEQVKKLAQDATVMKLLPLIDDMSRAIAVNLESLAPVSKTLEKTM